jgi:hypothetical protein
MVYDLRSLLAGFEAPDDTTPLKATPAEGVTKTETMAVLESVAPLFAGYVLWGACPFAPSQRRIVGQP